MTEAVKWSYSAVNTLRECNRKYYFAQVLATHGRKSKLRRKAYELKNMQNLNMWKGSVIDKFMETVIIPRIRDKQVLDFDLLATQAVELAKKQFAYSKYKGYENPFETKASVGDDFCILDIHELGKKYDEQDIQDAYDLINKIILNIPKIKMPDGQLLLDFLKQSNALTPNVNNWLVDVEGAMVKPQIDLIAYNNWKPVIIDWKLSDSYTSDYSNQLIICGITVYLKRLEKTDKIRYEYTDIKLFEVNLLKGIVKEHSFVENEINNIIDYINLTSKDILLLTKKGQEEDKIDIEDFELTDNEGSCKFCNYRSLCAYTLINNNTYDEESYIKFVQSNQFS